jgi:hypothetical protein
MPTPTLNTGFTVGPDTLIAAPGKFGILQPQIQLVLSGGLTALQDLANRSLANGTALSGGTNNWFSSTPNDAFSYGTGGAGSSNATFPTITVDTPGPNTGQFPAIYNSALIAGNSFNSSTGHGYFFAVSGSSNDPGVNPSSQQTPALCAAAQNAGCLVLITLFISNPAGDGGNPWPSVLTVGSTVYNQLIANLETCLSCFTTLNAAPFIISIQPEINESGLSAIGLNVGQWWMGQNAAGSGSPTSSQVTQMMNICIDYFISQGITRALWAFEPNAYSTPYNFGAPSSYDLVAFDTQPITQDPDTNLLTFMASTGKPKGIFSAIATAPPTGQAQNSINYSTISSFLASNFSSFMSAVWWPQTDALNLQLNASSVLTSPWVPLSGYRRPATAGGIGGG